MLEARVVDARNSIAEAGAGLLCGEPASAGQLSRYWLLQGAVEHFSERPRRAAEAFVAAYRADPTVHIADFGTAFDEAVEVAVLEAPSEFARLRSDPEHPDAVMRLNGRKAELPAEVDVGAYVVQLVDRDRVVFAEVVRLRPGVEHLLQTGLTARPETPVLRTDTVPREKAKVPGLLVVGISALGLAAIGGGLYLRENSAMQKATTLDQLDAARDRQVGLAAGGLTLAGVGVASIGLHFTLD